MAKTVRPPMGRMAFFVSSAFIDKRLSPLAVNIYGVVSSHLSVKREGWGYLYQRDIAELLGVARQVVNQHIRRLVEYGYLDKKQRFYKSGAQSSCEYRVRLDFELPAEYSRLPLTPDEDSAGAAPPVTVESPPPSSYDDTPVILGRQPRHPGVTLNKDMGNLSDGNLKEESDTEPFFVQEPSAEPESPAAWARRVEWVNGLPVMSKRLRAAGVMRNAKQKLVRAKLLAGFMPLFDEWEDMHAWPRGILGSEADRRQEYSRFVTVCLAHTLQLEDDPPVARQLAVLAAE